MNFFSNLKFTKTAVGLCLGTAVFVMPGLLLHGGRTSRIVTPLNNVLEVESRKGRLLQITDEIGRRTQYRYAEDLLTDVVHTDEGITQVNQKSGLHLINIIFV